MRTVTSVTLGMSCYLCNPFRTCFGIIIPHIVGSPLETASGWRTWFYICIGCVVVFVPFIFTMHGHWSPAKARTEHRAREEKIAQELKRLDTATA